METKTYARARAAKAALTKILAGHEVEAEVTAVEVGGGRFTAHAEFAPGTVVDALLTEDLAGFSWRLPALESVEDELPAEVDNPAAVALPPRKSGYINEVSAFGGVLNYVRGRIPELAEMGLGRKEVIDRLRAEGVAYGTARTQYQKWFANQKA